MENRDEIIREQNGENMDTAENAELQQEARGQVNALKSKFREEMVLKIQKAFSPERRKKTVNKMRRLFPLRAHLRLSYWLLCSWYGAALRPWQKDIALHLRETFILKKN